MNVGPLLASTEFMIVAEGLRHRLKLMVHCTKKLLFLDPTLTESMDRIEIPATITLFGGLESWLLL